jgi:hypothetical protein
MTGMKMKFMRERERESATERLHSRAVIRIFAD